MMAFSIPPQTRCPYLGLPHDVGTAYGFPTAGNCCHKAQPPAAIDLSHQQAYCLMSHHRACPVFQRQEAAPLPSALQAGEGRPGRRSGLRWSIVTVVLLVAAAVTWWYWSSMQPELVALLLPSRESAGGGSFSPAPITASATTQIVGTEENVFTPTAAIASPTAATAVVTPTLPPPAVFASAPATTATATVIQSPPHSPTPSPQPSATPPLTPQVSLTTTLPMRLGPATGYPASITVEAADYDIVAQDASGDWWLVCCTPAGNAGWLPAAQVTVAGDAGAVAVATPALPIANAVSVGINVRNGPGPSYGVVAVAGPNVDYRVVARNEAGDWWQICCLSGRAGWIFTGLVTVAGDTGSVPVAEDVPEPPAPTPTP